ncbi:MAG: hypothetical protein KDC85_20800 [Saprospiraceae bacterium]|nr:hypothetical protein [Saprospiraceae bacterium]
MKPRFLIYLPILTFCFTLFFQSCQNEKFTENFTDPELMLKQVAADPDYGVYHEAIMAKGMAVVRGDFDLETLGDFFKNNKSNLSICEIPDDALSNIRGGLAYKQSGCKIAELRKILEAKYPGYGGLSRDEYGKIDDYFNQYQQHPDYAQEILAIQNKKRNKK